MKLEDRISKMHECRKCGRNCAQAVLMAFPDITGLSDETAAKITNALGSGVAATQEICGVPNAIAIAIGMTHSDTPADKAVSSKEARGLIDKFAALNGERLTCRDLKDNHDSKPCNLLIEEGIIILHDHFSQK